MCEAEQLSFNNLEEIDLKKMSVTEKFEYFENQKNILNGELSDICKDISQGYGLKYLTFSVNNSKIKCDENAEDIEVKMKNHKHAVSVHLASTFSAKIELNSSNNPKNYKFRLIYGSKLHKFVDLPDGISACEMKSYPNRKLIDFKIKSELFFETCKIVLKQALEHYEPTEFFGCCGKYLQCSDMKRCLHEDLFYAKACKYKYNLEAGRIFYGKNRNID